MSKKRMKVIDLTDNGDETLPSSSKPASGPESHGRNIDILDLTGEDATKPCSLPPTSQQKGNVVKSHNNAIDLTEDNTEICTLTSRSPEPEEALRNFKPSRAAVSSKKNALLSKKLTPMVAEQQSNNLLDCNEYSWHNNTTQMSKNEHIDESTRIALILVSSLKNKCPVVNSHTENKTPFGIDIFTEEPYSEDVNLNNKIILDTNNLLKDEGIIAKDLSNCQKRALKPKTTKKKVNNKNIDFKLKQTDTQTLIKNQNMERNKIDFKKNSNLEGMIIRNRGREKEVQKNKTVAKLECKDSQNNLKIIKSSNSDFEQTRDTTRIMLNSKIQKEVTVLPKSILKPTSTQKEDLSTRIQKVKVSEGYKKSNTTKIKKLGGQITKKPNIENCSDNLKQIKKILKKFNTKITPTYSAENKAEEKNYFTPVPMESKSSEENVIAILNQNRKKIKTTKKVRFIEETVSNKPKSKRKRFYKDKLGNTPKPKLTDTQKNVAAEKFKPNSLNLTSSSFITQCDELNLNLKSPKTVSDNNFSDTSTNSCDSDKNNVLKTVPKIILRKMFTKPLDKETYVLGPTRTGDVSSNCFSIDTNEQSNQNTKKSFDHIGKNPTKLSKKLNPSIILTNNAATCNSYESEPELCNTGSKFNYPALSKFGLPDSRDLTGSTNTVTKKTCKRAHSPPNTINTGLDLKKKMYTQPSLSKPPNSATHATAASTLKENSKKKQESQEIPPVLSSENINYHIYNIISTITQNAFKPTISNQNTMPQPHSTKQSKDFDLTNIAAQQMNSLKKRQSQEIPPDLPTHNIDNIISLINTMTDNILKSRLPNQHSEDKRTTSQSCSSKQVNVTTRADAFFQQINLKRKQSQEQPPVVTSGNIEKDINRFRSMKDSITNCTLRNQHELSNSQLMQSTNAADKSAAPQQFNLTRRQSREMTPVVSSAGIYCYTNSFNTIKNSASSFTFPKQSDEFSTLLPNSLKRPENSAYTSVAPRQMNSERTQFWEIPAVATCDDIENNKNSFYTMTYNTSDPFQKKNDERRNSQPSSSKQLTNAVYTDISLQQLNLQERQSRKPPALANCDDMENNETSFYTMIHKISKPTLSKRNYKHSYPQKRSSKETTSATFKNVVPQQVNSERRQSREIPSVVISNNVENCNNSYNAPKHNAFNSTLPKLNNELSNPQPSSSKHSTNAISTIIAPKQINCQKRQSLEILPVAMSNDVKKFIDDFNAMKYNVHNFTFPEQTNDLCHSDSSSLKQSTNEASTAVAAQQATSKQSQLKNMPPVTPDFVEHFKNFTNVNYTNTDQKLRYSKSIASKDYLTVNRFDQAIVQPKASNTHKLREVQQHESTVNINPKSLNCQNDYYLGRVDHPQQFLMSDVLGSPEILEKIPRLNNFYATPNFQPNSYESFIQKVPVQQMHSSKVKSSQHHETNYIPHPNIGENYQRIPSHFNSIPENATNCVKNSFKRPPENSLSRPHTDTSRPPGLCNVFPRNVNGSNFASTNCPPAWPPPLHNPRNSSNSTYQTSIQTNIKRDIPPEKLLNHEACRNENIMLVSSPAQEKSERPTATITTNKSQLCDLLSSNSAPIDSSGQADLKSNSPLEIRVNQEEQTAKGSIMDFGHTLHKSEERSEEIMNNKTQTPHKPCDPSSSCSTAIDTTEQADFKNILSLEKRHDEEAQNSNRDGFNGGPGVNKPEPVLNKILFHKNVSTISHNDEVQKTLLCEDDDTKHLLSIIDSFIESTQ